MVNLGCFDDGRDFALALNAERWPSKPLAYQSNNEGLELA